MLVHGEFERNDMVEYFGECLEGYLFTEKAWVQSYGTRCVKPPIVWGDVSRAKPMTVKWSVYAQSLTKADEGHANRTGHYSELVIPVGRHFLAGLCVSDRTCHSGRSTDLEKTVSALFR